MKGKLKENNKIIDKLSLLEPAAEFKGFFKKRWKIISVVSYFKKEI